jgi:SAM-dependent methyltransferase
LQEAFSFYVFVKKYAEELGNPLRREHRFLDFGCGWGRYLRFFWKDIDENNLYGCDVNQHVLDICRTLNVPGHLALIDPEGDLPYPDSHFDTIMAYSVFTHLPERVHLHWMRELARVARPGCVFCLTLEPRRFIDFIASISPDTNTHQWHKLIAKFKPQVDEFYRIFDSGEMVFMQTNEDLEVQGTYGDAVVPLSFINREWSSYFTVHAYIDNPQEFWQAVLVTQRL